MGLKINYLGWALILGCSFSCTPSKSKQETAAIPVTESAKATPVDSKCSQTGIPLVEGIYTGEGEPIWELGQPFPKKGKFFDAIEIKGQNLCSGKLTMADGFSRAVPMKYTVLNSGNLKIDIPWELERITQSLLSFLYAFRPGTICLAADLSKQLERRRVVDL